MKTVFFFKNMLPEEQNRLQNYFLDKLKTFDKIIARFPDDGVVLQVKGEKFIKHSAYDIELTMKLPSETLTARETSHTIQKAVDLAKDRLNLQLKKTVVHVRREQRSIRARNKLKMRVEAEV